MTEKDITREVLVANVHACNGMVHVGIATELTIEESRKTRHAMEAAEIEAAEQQQEPNVHPIFGNLLDLFKQATEDGPSDAS